MYNLYQWDDFTTLVLAREKTLRDFLYVYWRRFVTHLMSSDEGLAFQQSWNAYLITTTPNSWMRSLGCRGNSVFPRRLVQQATHSLVEWLTFEDVQRTQYGYFRSRNEYLEDYISKYFLWTISDEYKT